MTLLGRLREHLRPPHWLPIALRQPQNLVRVMLASDEQRIDVTQMNVVAALDPLTIALPAIEGVGAANGNGARRLEFLDAASGLTLGMLKLQCYKQLPLAGTEAVLFRVTAGADYCQGWAQRACAQIARSARVRNAPASGGMQMTAAAIERLLIFYICPRPVVLVSVCEGSEGNLFPMDLIGPFGEGRFTLALRNTSPSVATMKRAATIALADVAARDCVTAYRLGAHHRTAEIDWQRLPFPMHRTAHSNIPYPAIALRIRELAMLDHVAMGSHSFFMAETVSDRSLSPEPRLLFHTTSSHQLYRSRCGAPLQSAVPGRAEPG